MLCQKHQKVKLFRREMNILAANDDAMLWQVDQEVPGFNDLWSVVAGGGVAAQLRADAGLKLLNAERLGDVVIGACVERFHFYEVLVADRKNDDRNLRNGANLAAQFNAVHLWHGDIGDDEVWLPCVHGLHSL